MDENFSFGYWLRRQRLARDLRQDDLAQRLGIATITLRKIEADERRPSRQLLERVAELFQLDDAELATLRRVARADLSPAELPLPARPAAVTPLASPLPPLPPQPTPFVGRSHELATLSEVLATNHGRLVTISGPGGMGKTRLALAAAEAQAVRALAPDGIAFVALAPVQGAAQLDATLALALGLQLTPSGPQRLSPRAQILNFLRAKQLLLILDNCEQLLEEVCALVSAVHGEAPAVRVLVTSRERLNLRGEQLLPLGGLSAGADDDASGLFFATAFRVQPGLAPGPEQRDTVQRICALLGGMPLAIELAAGWADTLALDQIESELSAGGLDLLASSAPDMPERHRSIHSVLSATWQQIGPEDRPVVARFAVFHGGCTREAAQTIAGATLQQLTTLVRKSIVQHSPVSDRFSMHELMRQYATAQLANDRDQEAAAGDRHATYFLHKLASYAEALQGAGHVAAVAAISQEHQNISAAWAHALGRPMPSLVGAAHDVLGSYYEWQGYLQEGAAAFREAAQVAEQLQVAGPLARAQLRAWHGVFCALAGRHEQARTELEQALAACEGEDDEARAAQAFVLRRLGRVEALQGGDAIARYQESLQRYRALGREWEVSVVLADLGASYHLQARYAEARQALVDGWTICERRGDIRGMSQALELLSQVALETGELEEARRLAGQCYDLAQTLGQHSRAVDALGRLGMVLMHLGDYRESATYLERSLARSEELGDTAMTALAHNRLALALLHDGASEAGRRHAEISVALARAHGGWLLAQALMVFAFATDSWDLAAADAALDEGIALCRAQGLSNHLGQLLAEQSGVAWDRGDVRRARACAVEALRLAVEHQSSMALQMALEPCVLPLLAAGEAQLAAELYGLGGDGGLWRRSRLIAPYRERLLTALREALGQETLKVVLGQGASRDRWQTAGMVLEHLEAAGWG